MKSSKNGRGQRIPAAKCQRIAWFWNGRQGYRVLKPGQPEYRTWKNGKRLTPIEEAEFEAALAW